MVKNVMATYKIHNAHVTFRGDHDVDELIDVIEGNRKYVRCLYVYNKIDTISIEDIDSLMQSDENVAISAHFSWGVELLRDKIWEQLGLVRVYTKKQSAAPDFEDPIILTKGRGGVTIKSAIMQIHKGLLDDFAHGVVWGRSVKYSPQKVGLTHELMDEDVLQIAKRVGGPTPQPKVNETDKTKPDKNKKDAKGKK